MHKLKIFKRLTLGASMVSMVLGVSQVGAESLAPAAVTPPEAKVAATVALVAGDAPEQTPGVNAAAAVAPDAAPQAAPAAAASVVDTPTVDDAAANAEREKRKAEIASKVRNPTLRGHLMDNIDIFGKSDLPAIYILGPGIEEFEGQLLTRDFARDPFFMQNIDREEFEMKMWLHSDYDEDRKKKEEAK